jgi:glycosyltransferase involved in cell wall biosynthesis
MKPLFIISSPFDTYSGYGARSRDLIKAIVATDKYNVRLLYQRWGNTAFGFCNENPEWKFLYDLVLPQNQIPMQPEIFAQVTIPSEFQQVGKFNIGFTAGIETNLCSGEWVEGMNRMDLNIVSSNHAKKVFEESQYEKRNKQTNEIEGIVKLEKPIEVLFEGVDLDVYKVLDKVPQSDLYNSLMGIKEKFAYLFVGHWLQGDLGEDRKNVGLLIKAFCETFKNKMNKPALILKTSQVTTSYVDREEILKKIKQITKTVNSKNLPNIYLLHGEFTDEEMNELYNHPKVKAMVSLTKGEGFGRPLLEFTTSKKPLICSGWSGQVDFLNPEYTCLVGGQLNQVHASAANQWILAESHWFAPDHMQVGFFLKDVFENYKNYTERGKRQAHRTIQEFSWGKMKEKIDEILTKSIPEFPEEVKLKIPHNIKKIELPKKPE